MKKSLFAIAAVTAFAGAAQAQSSVTVYGIVDVGYAGGNSRASTSSAVNQATFSMLQASGGLSSNRLGFRGVEDLGGGTSAKFVLESSLQANQDAWTPTWRQAWAGLAQKGLGEARIGTQNSMIWQLASTMTVGQLNNFSGSVINPTSIGGVSGITNPNSTAVAETRANDANSVGFTNRTQRTLQLETERMSGFQAKAMYVLNNANNNRSSLTTAGQLGYTGGTNNQNGWGVSLDFNGVKNLRVAAAYQSFNAENPYNATAAQINSGSSYTTGGPVVCPGNAASNTNTFTTTTTSCTNIKDNQAYVAATYNFGILTAYANYINRKATSQQTSNVYLSRTAQEIGVRGNVTKVVEAYASLGNGRYQAFGANQPTANFTGYQVGANYLLSKRTNVYAIYGQSGTSSATNNNLTGNVNNYGMGVRHTF
jgi:predicted porin